jgi:hypothetical protein
LRAKKNVVSNPRVLGDGFGSMSSFKLFRCYLTFGPQFPWFCAQAVPANPPPDVNFPRIYDSKYFLETKASDQYGTVLQRVRSPRNSSSAGAAACESSNPAIREVVPRERQIM